MKLYFCAPNDVGDEQFDVHLCVAPMTLWITTTTTQAMITRSNIKQQRWTYQQGLDQKDVGGWWFLYHLALRIENCIDFVMVNKRLFQVFFFPIKKNQQYTHASNCSWFSTSLSSSESMSSNFFINPNYRKTKIWRNKRTLRKNKLDLRPTHRCQTNHYHPQSTSHIYTYITTYTDTMAVLWLTSS